MSKPITIDYRDTLTRVGRRHRITGEKLSRCPECGKIGHTVIRRPKNGKPYGETIHAFAITSMMGHPIRQSTAICSYDDDDMRWWESQLKSDRDRWIWMHQRECQRALDQRRARLPFHLVWAEFEEQARLNAEFEERCTLRFMADIRAAFTSGKPMDRVDWEKWDPALRATGKRALKAALERCAIPTECLGLEGGAE